MEDLWPEQTSFSSEEIYEYCDIFLTTYPQESFPTEHAYYAQLKADNA